MILYYRILEFRSTKRLIAAHSLVEWATIDRNAGDQSVGATLVPIPNTIVKPYSADGTPLARARESRPSPAPHCKTPDQHTGRGFCVFYQLRPTTPRSLPGAKISQLRLASPRPKPSLLAFIQCHVPELSRSSGNPTPESRRS